MEFVMSLCTRVLVLAEGRLIAEGRPPTCAPTRPSSKPISGIEMSDPETLLSWTRSSPATAR